MFVQELVIVTFEPEGTIFGPQGGVGEPAACSV